MAARPEVPPWASPYVGGYDSLVRKPGKWAAIDIHDVTNERSPWMQKNFPRLHASIRARDP